MKTLIDISVPLITFILLAAVGLDLSRGGLRPRAASQRCGTCRPAMLVAIAAFRSRGATG
jgi:hypothetical protein